MPANVHQQYGVVAVIRELDRFLLIKRSDYVETAKGYWCPVSGRIETGETPEDALRREVMEEVGLYVEAHEKVAQIPSFDNKFTLSFWTTKNHSGNARVVSKEVLELRWATLEEMDKLSPMFEDDVKIMKSVAKAAGV